ncbi:MAG TPA: hypothetical protein VHJ78_13885 [Actinomycetota bacterium]|nr:hypothetical protein [Actinomycetota bacterium]
MERGLRWRIAVIAAAMVAAAACGGEPGTGDPPPSAGATAVSPAAPGGPDEAPTTPVTRESADAGAIDLADGRHPAYIMGVDVRQRRVEIDVIQFLTGPAAAEAYRRDNPDDPEGPPNDYYIVNSNPRVRAGTLAEGAAIRLVKLQEDRNADLDPATVEELRTYVGSTPGSNAPFWVTVSGGRIAGIEEQYVP